MILFVTLGSGTLMDDVLVQFSDCVLVLIIKVVMCDGDGLIVFNAIC